MKVRTLATVDLPAGCVLTLTEGQVRRRRRSLVSAGRDWLTTAPVQFKAGEVFGLAGEPGKQVLAGLEVLEGGKPAKAARPARPAVAPAPTVAAIDG